MKGQIVFHKNGTRTYKLDGQVVTKREFDRKLKKRGAKAGVPMVTKAYNKPLKSWSWGCHTSQATEWNEDARKAGITGVYYDPATGRAQFSSRESRARELQRLGRQDNDGGYGDG